MVSLSFDLTLFPLCAQFLDDLAEAEGIDQSVRSSYDDRGQAPILDGQEVERLVELLEVEGPYAVIETDYFGGVGEQAAVIYLGEETVFGPERGPVGAINKALRRLGVRRTLARDEFDTVGLGNMRRSSDFFRDRSK
ncbi:MAG: hypothetical protein AAGM22_24515 [Acidobacteriota bacterium]